MSEDDKQWFAGLIGRIDARMQSLENGLQSLENGLQSLENRMQSLENGLQVVEAQNQTLEIRMFERIERTEKRLLTAFHDWASQMEARVRSHSATLRALDLEMETNLAAIKARLDQLEAGRRQQ
jgi:chromosome segregation ATPase